MKVLSTLGVAEQPSGEAAGAGPGERHKAGGSASEFRMLLGSALKHAARAAHGQAARPGAAPAQPDGSALTGEPGTREIGAAPGDGTESSGPADGVAPGEAEPGAPRRPGARKRRESDGPERPSEQPEQGAAPAAAPPQRETAAGTPTPTRLASALSDAQRLPSASAVKQPAAAPSAAKPAPAQPHDREKPREREPVRAAEAGSPPARSEPPSLPAAAEAKAAPRPPPAPEAARSAPPLPPPPDGQEVGGAVLQHAAHLHVEAGALGPLSLHLRVREGALHLRVDGEAAAVVEARSGELSRALASEGLRLAPIEPPSREGAGMQSAAGGGGGRQGEERREAWNDAADARGAQPERPRHAPSARGATQPAPDEAALPSRGVHVKA